MIASGDPQMARMGAQLEESGITQWSTNQVLMVKPEDGSVYLATEQEIQDKDLPVHVSVIGRNDPELAKRLQDAGIEYVRPSEGLGEDADGNLVVISKEDMDAYDASQQPQGATTMTTDVIRAMDTTFAGGTMSADQVAREMERQKIYEVPDGQMLVRHEDGRLENSRRRRSAGRHTFVLYGE